MIHASIHRRSSFRVAVFLALCALVLAGMTQNAEAQRTVNITPGFGTLNSVIMGDTLPSGQRVDTNTVYLLQRGGLYILNGSMDHAYPVNIQAAPGAGAKPKIVQGVPSGGVAPAQAWLPRATLRMKNIVITAYDELGGNHERIIRITGNGLRIYVDSCHLDGASQAGFRFDGTDARVYFTNSIISNIGGGTSPDNGRGFDDRGNNIDTLVVENSTFYNLTSRVIRDGGGFIRYCKVNHITAFNIGQFGLSFGEVYTASFTNNLFHNGGYYGNPNGRTDPNEVISVVKLKDTLATQQVNIRNNTFWLDSLIIKAYPDTVKPLPLFDSLSLAFIQQAGTGATIYQEPITFQKVPAPPVAVVQDWYTNPAPPNPELDTVGQPFNFRYTNAYLAYARGSDGKPLGDLNWHNIPLVAVEQVPGIVPDGFRLHDNYPNPFNPSTTIRFDVRQQSGVTIAVFNMLGQRIATLVDEQMAPGTYTVRWDGTTDAGAKVASGLYIYRMEAGSFVSAHKMILTK